MHARARLRTVIPRALVTLFALLLLAASPTAVEGGTNGHIYTVNTTTDNDTKGDPTCSLREAIKASNAGAASYNGCVAQNNPTTDDNRIQFDLGPGNPTINVVPPGFDLIISPVVIDGATGGATRVVLHGPGVDEALGLYIDTGAHGSEVRNLVINNFLAGFPLRIVAEDVQVAGNFIGTNAAGTSAVPNRVGLNVSGNNARIGGISGLMPTMCTGDCNLISGNEEYGVNLQTGTGIYLEGNFIGTNVTGTAAIPNPYGVTTDTPGASIGTIGAGNLISGNTIEGIDVSAKTYVQGNLIGTNAAGTAAVPNQTGIYMDSSSNESVIGGLGAGNIISGNLGNGVAANGASSIFIAANYIGTKLNHTDPLPNGEAGVFLESTSFSRVGSELAGGNVIAFNGGDGVRVTDAQSYFDQIRYNSIFSNDLKGIELVAGSNGGITPPVILSADATQASGTAAPACVGSPCAVDVYSDSADEGRIPEGSVLTDAAGAWTYTGSLTGPHITATVMDDGGDSSEFSAPFNIQPATPTPSPTPSPSATPTATATPTPTPTPTASPVANLIQGDVNCDGDVNEGDFEDLIEYAAGLSDGTMPDPCPDLNAAVPAGIPSHPWGDVNCDDAVNALDSLYVLAYTVGVELLQQANCRSIGNEFD